MRATWPVSALIGVILTPLSAHAQAPGSTQNTIRAAVERLAADMAARNTSAADEQGPAGLSAWARVASLDAGSEILLARSSAAPSRYRLLTVQDDSLTILDVSSPSVPGAVARQLRRDATRRPSVLLDARAGRETALSDRITIGPSGVSDRGKVLIPLSLVVIDVPRADVDELSVIRKHIGEHAKRGMIIGAIIGGVLAGTGSASCDGGGCGNPAGWAVAGALGGSLVGLEYGTIIGLIAPRSPDLVYRR